MLVFKVPCGLPSQYLSDMLMSYRYSTYNRDLYLSGLEIPYQPLGPSAAALFAVMESSN